MYLQIDPYISIYMYHYPILSLVLTILTSITQSIIYLFFFRERLEVGTKLEVQSTLPLFDESLSCLVSHLLEELFLHQLYILYIFSSLSHCLFSSYIARPDITDADTLQHSLFFTICCIRGVSSMKISLNFPSYFPVFIRRPY